MVSLLTHLSGMLFFQDAQSYADDNSLLFMETSAKTSMNVNEIFMAIGMSSFLPQCCRYQFLYMAVEHFICAVLLVFGYVIFVFLLGMSFSITSLLNFSFFCPLFYSS